VLREGDGTHKHPIRFCWGKRTASRSGIWTRSLTICSTFCSRRLRTCF
jgi:hypothetical protein